MNVFNNQIGLSIPVELGELSELTEGLAVAGPEDRQSTAKDRPGRLIFGRGRTVDKSVPRSPQEPSSSQSGVGSPSDDVEAEVDELPGRKTAVSLSLVVR